MLACAWLVLRCGPKGLTAGSIAFARSADAFRRAICGSVSIAAAAPSLTGRAKSRLAPGPDNRRLRVPPLAVPHLPRGTETLPWALIWGGAFAAAYL